MYLDGNRLVLSPSDLVAHLYCPHVTELSLEVASGRREKPDTDDPQVEVVQARGIEHEAKFLASLQADGDVVIEIQGGDLHDQVQRTVEALAAGPDIVYQATFLDEAGTGPAWRGHADFLHRTARSSGLGDYSYEPSDTKLARHVRPSAVLQLCEYAAQLARLQGTEPERIHVVLGGSDVVTLRLADFATYHRAARRRFGDAATAGESAYPLPNQHSAVCPWIDRCEAQWKSDDHLVRVAGLTVEQARRFEQAGITTSRALVAFTGKSVRGIGDTTLEKLREQARLQRKARYGQPPPYELLPTAESGQGLGSLPAPSPGDLFFDIEGDPFVGDAGLEYLLGVGWTERDGGFGFRAYWAHTPDEEKASFEAFIDFVTACRAADPAMHVYHFAPYETTAVGRLMGRYGTREAEVDELLRATVFVDLHRVVRQCVRVGTPSYSLKKLESLYMDRRTDAIVDAGSSIVEYERWLQSEDRAILDNIESYNKTDCDSTRGLRGWLEGRREEYQRQFGVEPPRPSLRDGSAPEIVQHESTEIAVLARALVGDDDDPTDAVQGHDLHAAPPDDVDAEERTRASGRRLLADLLEWHRREAKPGWWRYYHRVEADEDDLFDDTEAIAGLTYIGPGETVGRSVVHHYAFNATQEYKLGPGDQPVDPEVVRARKRDEKRSGPGTIQFIDAGAGVLGLRRGTASTAEHPRVLIPGGPIPDDDLRSAMRRVGSAVVGHGIDEPGPFRAVRDLILRHPPRLAGTVAPRGDSLVNPGELPADAAVRLARQLDGGCLAIQGPPGSGKTSAAARIAVELLRGNKRIGVTANSHAVICHLLGEILTMAEREKVPVRASQKGEEHQVLAHPAVRRRGAAPDAVSDLDADTNLVAGTAWLFCRPDMEDRLDYVLVDEAGQLSLANAVAVGTSARNIILVGDPRQLAQPSQGTHPDGAGASALEHLLGEHDTMPPDLGIFLDRTHRLHPDICRFVSEIVYEGRLESDPDCARQRISGDGELGGSGIRWRPVDHAGNRCSSEEEADAVAVLHADLLGRTFVDRDGVERPMNVDDVLVVAPYNAQVSLLARKLPNGARVGTVDRFQGQQAPVVIVSLATSSLDEIPRGMEFLYSRNRLNVAVSRAQALTVVVGSPALLSVRCNTVNQLRLANGLCRLVELAQP